MVEPTTELTIEPIMDSGSEATIAEPMAYDRAHYRCHHGGPP